MCNNVQYHLDRSAVKISAYSSDDLRKYECLTGEDLGYKPNVVEQVKFDYSPLGKIFNKGLDEEGKKEGLFKRLKNIEDKNEQLLKASNVANKGKATKNESHFSYDSRYAFYRFYGEFKKIKRMASLGSNHGDLK